MNYEIYKKENEKRVKFDDGTDYCINTDNEGREYFPIPNYFIKDKKIKLFSGRIKDAIESIRNGYGDVLAVGGIFGKTESVYKYVDRDYGEQIRQKTIEGFKNTEFGYSIKFGLLNSFSGFYGIKKDGDVLSIFDKESDRLYFNTLEEAEKYKENLLIESKRFADMYINLEINNPNKLDKWIKKNYNLHSVKCNVGSYMLEEKENPWGIKIIQIIKQ